MSGQQLLQVASFPNHQVSGVLQVTDGSGQFGGHLLTVLRREQAALRFSRMALGLEDRGQLATHGSVSLLRSLFRFLHRQLRHVVGLL